MDPIQLWNAIKEELRQTISQGFSYTNYVDTLKPLQLVENENNTVTLQLTTAYEQVASEWLNASSSYYQAFMQAAMTATLKLTGQPTFIIPSVTYVSPTPTTLFDLPEDKDEEKDQQQSKDSLASEFVTQSILNPEFRFETFALLMKTGKPMLLHKQ